MLSDPAVIEPETVAPPEPGMPEIDRTADLATKVAELRSSDPGSRELECLAVGIYFESKSEPLIGQLAVGEVKEHTSELQSPCNLVCRLLLEKKKRVNTQLILEWR